MSQEQTAPNPDDADDLRAEYRFDYTKARPNRFAPRQPDGSLVVVIEPDIAQIFTTPESVNRVLRALIETMPPMDPAT
jgi:hypothetical protein